ncbi:MAG: hypothetical protein GEEBNDBF_00902 [bacterium]|nr:hypothetical protein [bacterium]
MRRDLPDPWDTAAERPAPPSRLQGRLAAFEQAQRQPAPPPPWYRRSWHDDIDGMTGEVIAYGLCATWFLCVLDGVTHLLWRSWSCGLRD